MELKNTLRPDQMLKLQTLLDDCQSDELKYAVKDKELSDFQQASVYYAKLVEKCIISLDTGLGKTLVFTALINLTADEWRGTNKKWILFVQNANLKSTYKKVKAGLFNATIGYCGANTNLAEGKMWAGLMCNNVLILSYETLINQVVTDALFDIQDDILGVGVDESHMICANNSAVARILRYMLPPIRYSYFLTATPIRVSPIQLINQIVLLDPDMFQGVPAKAYREQFIVRDVNNEVIGFKHLEELQDDIDLRYIGATRADFGLKGDRNVRVLLCEPKPEYLKLKKMETFSMVKGDPTGPALDRFRDLILDKKARGQIGVAYVNLNKNKDMLLEQLEECGINVGILDGHHTAKQEEKEMVESQFQSGEFDILLTNITTGKDLQCNYIVFYELTFDFQQFLGRGERGLEKNNLDVIFIIVRDTSEVAYFHDNVLQRAEILALVSGKDISEIKDAYKDLQKQELSLISV